MGEDVTGGGKAESGGQESNSDGISDGKVMEKRWKNGFRFGY